MYSFSKFIIILLAALFSQAAMAEKFEVISSNTLKYRPGFMLTENHKVRLNAGEQFILKAPNSIHPFRIEGPYMESKAGTNCKRDTLIGILTCIVANSKPKCDPNTVKGVLKCIIKPIIPNTESERSPDSLMNDLWSIIKPRLFNEILPPSSSSEKQSKTDKITVPNDPWLLVAPSDQDFCYRPDKPLTIWRPDILMGQLILLTGPSDDQASSKAPTGLEDLLVITLHAMPDDNTLPSNTYKAVWMAEKGCYRQAQLLLSLDM